MSDEQPIETEGESAFAARLTEELGRILGTGILIQELVMSDGGDGDDVRGRGARIRVLCLFDGEAEPLEAEGETTLAAFNRLVASAAELRLAIASRRMIAPI